MIIIGVDTGGTFTDFIYKKDNEWGVLKIPSTPHNPAEAVLKGIQLIAESEKKNVVHGSTVATNAVLERKGAKTAFITNRGFEDILFIGRQNREKLYDLHYRKPVPLIPSSLVFGVKGRITSKGEEIEPLDVEELQRIAEALKKEKVESVAVSFLFSFLNPSHEEKAFEILNSYGFDVSISSRIVPEFREFERSSTTLINAYVMPKMKKYISFLESHLGNEDRLSIMQSNGGIISSTTAKEQPVRTILSGPAGGVTGAWKIGSAAGYDKLITFDMGGTSTDVSLIDGKPTITTEAKIEGYPIKVPVIDIHTVGAGGGSIAKIDAGGALSVGPESAGADPGPICYGKGEKITVTDANLFLGRLVPDYFLGGKMKLYPERIIPYFEKMAEEAGLSPVELAKGIIDVANAKMEKAIRVISIERGYDTREFSLFSFGGAGGLHAAFLAKALNIPQVIVPLNPGILSAMGMLLSDVVKDYSLTVMVRDEELSLQTLDEFFKVLEDRAFEELISEGIEEENIFLERFVDVRYRGQSFELIVPFSENFVDDFHREHEKVYGYSSPEREVEVVNVRLRATGRVEKPKLEKFSLASEKVPDEAVLCRRKAFFDDWMEVPVYDRSKLLPGNRIKGAAIIVEYSSTTVVPPFAEVFVDEYKNLIVGV
ncbi:N-methylhydantoinase A [Desulfurobacterium pacificum]|uniref:N-methylhydantoinase A n=1 Tax=Desulfurobacterium pacificum TaxID=240166 RepID=A0ABY1NQ31_9BACT|nr:hydantoinase/oxoprolinase family protein [Desulfurobacterium pacificum]SMP15290.1 N-methylhydantoinase A [Desulfurobacterium pacificum]